MIKLKKETISGYTVKTKAKMQTFLWMIGNHQKLINAFYSIKDSLSFSLFLPAINIFVRAWVQWSHNNNNKNNNDSNRIKGGKMKKHTCCIVKFIWNKEDDEYIFFTHNSFPHKARFFNFFRTWVSLLTVFACKFIFMPFFTKFNIIPTQI